MDAANGELEPPLTSLNQYRALHLSDQVGPHADPAIVWERPSGTDRTAAPRASHLRKNRAHINEVWWAHDRGPAWWPAYAIASQVPEHTIALAIRDPALVGSDGVQRRFVKAVPPQMTLRAEGERDVPGSVLGGGVSSEADGAFLFVIEDPSLLVPGVAYAIVTDTEGWTVPEDLSVVAH